MLELGDGWRKIEQVTKRRAPSTPAGASSDASAATDLRRSGADGGGLSWLVGIVGESVDLIGNAARPCS
jgi:hypothetical protein